MISEAVMHLKICVIRSTGEKRRKIFGEIMAENWVNFVKTFKLQIEETDKSQTDETVQRNHTQVYHRLLKTRHKEKILKATKEKRHYNQETVLRMKVYSSSETLGARRQWIIYKVLKRKTCEHPFRLFQK